MTSSTALLAEPGSAQRGIPRPGAAAAMALQQPPFSLDFRIATSVIESLRFLLATRIADLGDLVGRLETVEVHLSARRARLRLQLGQNEAERQRCLSSLSTLDPAELEAVFGAGVSLGAQLGALDERIGALEHRLKVIREEMAVLRELLPRLRDSSELRGRRLDEAAVRSARAVRGLGQLVEAGHDAMIRRVIEGPLQRLMDASVGLQVVQRLVGGGLPGAAAELARCRAAAEAAFAELDRHIFELRPASLDAWGVGAALRELARVVPPPVACRFELIGEERRLRPSLEVAIFRVAQEALHNALRHGRPQRVDIVLSLHRERVVIMVRDEGEGFDVSATEARLGRTGTLGLITMRERTLIEGGSLKLRSASGAGTEVRATFDLEGRPPPPTGLRTGHRMIPEAAPPG